MSSVIERLRVEMEPARNSLRIVCCEREHLRKLIAAYEAVKALVPYAEQYADLTDDDKHPSLDALNKADRAARELEGT